jgi:hypothetical protein
MVTITNYKERTKEDGSVFFVLEIQGGVELVQSQSTGNYYATAKRTFIPTTFDEPMCISVIGEKMKGSILKEQCEPYEYTVKETGEVLILTHKWVYSPEDPAEKPRQKVNQSDNFASNFNSFVKKDVLEPEYAN